MLSHFDLQGGIPDAATTNQNSAMRIAIPLHSALLCVHSHSHSRMQRACASAHVDASKRPASGFRIRPCFCIRNPNAKAASHPDSESGAAFASRKKGSASGIRDANRRVHPRTPRCLDSRRRLFETPPPPDFREAFQPTAKTRRVPKKRSSATGISSNHLGSPKINQQSLRLHCAKRHKEIAAMATRP